MLLFAAMLISPSSYCPRARTRTEQNDDVETQSCRCVTRVMDSSEDDPNEEQLGGGGSALLRSRRALCAKSAWGTLARVPSAPMSMHVESAHSSRHMRKHVTNCASLCRRGRILARRHGRDEPARRRAAFDDAARSARCVFDDSTAARPVVKPQLLLPGRSRSCAIEHAPCLLSWAGGLKLSLSPSHYYGPCPVVLRYCLTVLPATSQWPLLCKLPNDRAL